MRKIVAMHSPNLSFFGQELKSSHSNKLFLLPNSMFRKKKKLTAKIYLIAFALTETKDHISPFQVDLPPLHHQFFDIFRWLERVV